MRHFKQLTNEKLREIYVGFLSAEPKLRIAKRLQIDNSTVHYHINKVKDLPRSNVIALIAPQCASGHTSFKCLVCGKGHDNIKNDEFQEIIRLRKRVAQLEEQLNPHHEQASSSNIYSVSPVVCVSD